MTHNACYGCDHRSPGCHEGCVAYGAYRAEMERYLADKKRRADMARDYINTTGRRFRRWPKKRRPFGM